VSDTTPRAQVRIRPGRSGRDGPPDVARLTEIGARNGMVVLGPPAPPPGH
jgi:hypothetical protein